MTDPVQQILSELEEKHNPKGALTLADELLKEVLSAKGKCFWVMKDIEAAQKCYEQALQLDKDYAPAVLGLQDCLTVKMQKGLQDSVDDPLNQAM